MAEIGRALEPSGAGPGSRQDQPSGGRAPDMAASLALSLVVAAALLAAWWLPWWTMKSNAPQYGQRVLVIDVGPRIVEGDVREIDTLGKYVGIRPMGAIASLERALAPYGLVVAVVGILLVPWVRPRWLRLVLVLPVLVMPLLMPLDIKLWMDRAVNQRSEDAALELSEGKIEPELVGAYQVGQFKVRTEFGTGFYLDVLAALLALGLAFAVPLPLPGTRREAQGSGAAGARAG